MSKRDAIREIKGTITLADGSTSEFMLTVDLGWQQWGASQERLGQTVYALDAMVEGLAELWMTEQDDD